MVWDYIIIGQGIAGTVLSETLIARGKKVLVIDDDSKDNATKVAAGICNPITGRHLSKTWMADEIFPFLKLFYSNLENKLGIKFFFEKAIYRPFKSIEEQNQWFGRSMADEWKDFLNTHVADDEYSKLINNELGGWETKHSCQIDTTALLESYRDFLKGNQILKSDEFHHKELIIHENQIDYLDEKANKIIFCEGFFGVNC